jgi:hypothetical protein
MGNIGNLNCGHDAYIKNDRSTSESSSPSRIEQDLSSSPHQDNYMEKMHDIETPMIRRAVGRIPHVCIVGAGVAGLRCADVLLQHGAKVTILEGRDRVGGRVCYPQTSPPAETTANQILVMPKQCFRTPSRSVRSHPNHP